MGIQGLLPLLKPIQRQRHLSELSGQTIAVDGYVWLHRGAYACAQELAQGKPTRRYVDFCMARVRLLRHHGIAPYLVFDGGPLPAKLGTEKEREKKRAENIAIAKELMKKGWESQAREHFVKCIDVTPQMAYQVIKALKAENIPYVVAPYEADAQLAYLERMNIVDGILTEDSDLLVFGCRNVYFKLDTVKPSVIHIARKDFGSPSLCIESFSLIGWSEAEFRRMAMLSGCDYLPSIPGVGLKGAYTMLKKHKTVDKAVKMLRFEGKKKIPDGYLEAFELAEKVFLYQRVFDPLDRQIVYLSEPNDDLGDEAERYIGQAIDADVAKGIADGDVCPISLEPMEDINPKFKPHTSKLPLQSRNKMLSSSSTPKGKKTGGLLSFFNPLPPSASPRCSTTQMKSATVGNASGKRTLVEVMGEDAAVKRKRISQSEPHTSTSKFFSAECKDALRSPEKENIPIAEENLDNENDDFDPVTQEDGYISPSPSSSRHLTPELSSPLLSRTMSMPVRHGSPTQALVTQDLVNHILVRGSSEPAPEKEEATLGPNLAFNFGDDEDLGDETFYDDASSEITPWDDDVELDKDKTTTPPSSFEDTQRTPESFEVCEDYSSIHARLAHKWKATFSLHSAFGIRSTDSPDEPSTAAQMESTSETPVMMRRNSKFDTYVTSPSVARSKKRDRVLASRPIQHVNVATAARSRSTAAFFQGKAGAGTRSAPISIDDEFDLDEIEDDEMMVTTSARGKLQSFRFSR